MKEETAQTFAVLAALAIGGLILYKSGAFGLTSKVTDAAESIIDDIMALPQNAIAILGNVSQLPMTIQQNMAEPLTQQSLFEHALQGEVQTFPGVVSVTQKVANMIQSTYQRYAGVTATNWSRVARDNGAVFDEDGFIIRDNSSAYNPYAWDVPAGYDTGY